MTDSIVNNGNNKKSPSFEWWMISNVALGAGFSAFVSLLIPPYVTNVTGSATDAGVVMAIISLAAIMGPILGGFADRYRAHRLILSLGVLGMSLGFLAYGISAKSNGLFALDAILIGVSIAAMSAVGPVFIVGAGLSQELEAKRMTIYSLVAPVGQVLGGVLMGAAASASWSYNQRFLLAAVIMFLCAVITWFSSKKPSERIQIAEPVTVGEVKKTQSVGLKGVLISTFGMYLLILILSSVANNGINNQIANIMPNVYGIDEATTSGLISLAGLLNIGLFFLAGAWMARSGAMPVFSMGNILRLLGALGMAVVGLIANAPVLIAVAFMQILYQGVPFVRLTQASLSVRFATIPAGQAVGWVIGASAIGSFLGSVLGGMLADKVGFNAINWMAAIAAGLAVLLIFISLWPAERKKRSEEQKFAAAV